MKNLKRFNEEIWFRGGDLDLEVIKKRFDSLSEFDQWKWLVETAIDFKDRFQIGLDNDTTSICFDDDIDANYLMYFKSDIGNRQGVEDILGVLGFKAYGV